MGKLAFIVQARLGSTRLPNKMILPFYQNKGIFEILIERLKENFPEVDIYLVTSTNVENDKLEAISKFNKISVFRGDENDVLNRFLQCAKLNSITKIIRICADNPFLDMKELANLLSYPKIDRYDYISFKIKDTPSIKTHFGFWAEYVTLKSLEKVYKKSTLSLYKEHVTNFIYENPKYFKIHFLKPYINLDSIKDIRLTLDTIQDFKTLKYIYNKMVEKKLEINIFNIINFLSKFHHLKIDMLNEINKNIK